MISGNDDPYARLQNLVYRYNPARAIYRQAHALLRYFAVPAPAPAEQVSTSLPVHLAKYADRLVGVLYEFGGEDIDPGYHATSFDPASDVLHYVYHDRVVMRFLENHELEGLLITVPNGSRFNFVDGQPLVIPL